MNKSADDNAKERRRLTVGWQDLLHDASVALAALEVEDFDAAIAHLKEHRVEFRIEPLPTPVCRMAMIFDPDGNSICIHKRNPGR